MNFFSKIYRIVLHFFSYFLYLLVALSFFSTLYFNFYFPTNLMISYLPYPSRSIFFHYFIFLLIPFLINSLLKSMTATDINISTNFSILLVSFFLTLIYLLNFFFFSRDIDFLLLLSTQYDSRQREFTRRETVLQEKKKKFNK